MLIETVLIDVLIKSKDSSGEKIQPKKAENENIIFWTKKSEAHWTGQKTLRLDEYNGR